MTHPEIGPEIPGYRFVQPLGRGGYSDVYEYEQDLTRQRVAVKVLRVETVSDLTMRMFGTEAQSMARLATHPFIVKVFQAGFASDGRPYLVMQYYPPPHLGKRAPLGTPQVLRTGIQLASAVETAHRAGILHRDIKPANILVDEYGAPGLTDFGIAGDASQAEDDGSGGVSIPWSPPEVLNGTSHGSVQADVYSLGATLWHLLVGRSPFWLPSGDNSERALLARILTTPAPATGKAVPPQLELLLQQVI